jgi:hypothetical protein
MRWRFGGAATELCGFDGSMVWAAGGEDAGGQRENSGGCFIVAVGQPMWCRFVFSGCKFAALKEKKIATSNAYRTSVWPQVMQKIVCRASLLFCILLEMLLCGYNDHRKILSC